MSARQIVGMDQLSRSPTLRTRPGSAHPPARISHVEVGSRRGATQTGIRHRRPARSRHPALVEWEPGRVFRLLYIVRPECRKVAKTIRRLLTLPQVRLTVVADGDTAFRLKIQRKVPAHPQHLRILAGTGRASGHLRQSHLVLMPEDAQMVRAALVAERPVIAIRAPAEWLGDGSGQLGTWGMGAVARKPMDAVRLVRLALRHRGYLYRRWLRQIERWSQPV